MTRLLLRCCVALAASFLALLALSSTSYGQLFGNSFAAGQLYDISTTTGAATNGRGSGATFLNGIAFQPATGNLFGLTDTDSSLPNSLVSIDPTTGVSTLIGATGLSNIIEGDLAFNPLNGNLYGVQDLPNFITRSLFQIDPATGHATPIGNLAGGDFSALAFDGAGVLYTIDPTNDQVDTIDPMTGTLLTTTRLSIRLGATVGLAFDPATGAAYLADGGAGATNNLYTLDTATGVATLVGALGMSDTAGLAFRPATVPEPSTWALLCLGAAGLGLTLRRRTVRA